MKTKPRANISVHYPVDVMKAVRARFAALPRNRRTPRTWSEWAGTYVEDIVDGRRELPDEIVELAVGADAPRIERASVEVSSLEYRTRFAMMCAARDVTPSDVLRTVATLLLRDEISLGSDT